LDTVLIMFHRARLSPRVIPGPSQFVALFLRGNHGWDTAPTPMGCAEIVSDIRQYFRQQIVPKPAPQTVADSQR